MRKVLMSGLILSICFAPLGCSGNLVDTVLADLPIATDIAISVVDIVSPGDAAYVQEVTEYAGKASADLKLMESLIKQYKNNLAAAPGGAIAQINAALNDAQGNLTAILQAVGASDPKVTAAVAAAVGSVKLILGDAALLLKNSTPAEASARRFFGVGMPGVDFPAMSGQKTQARARAVQPHPAQQRRIMGAPGVASHDSSRGSGKSARQIAQEYNQKIAKDFPRAKVNVPKAHWLGIPLPLTARK